MFWNLTAKIQVHIEVDFKAVALQLKLASAEKMSGYQLQVTMNDCKSFKSLMDFLASICKTGNLTITKDGIIMSKKADKLPMYFRFELRADDLLKYRYESEDSLDIGFTFKSILRTLKGTGSTKDEDVKISKHFGKKTINMRVGKMVQVISPTKETIKRIKGENYRTNYICKTTGRKFKKICKAIDGSKSNQILLQSIGDNIICVVDSDDLTTSNLAIEEGFEGDVDIPFIRNNRFVAVSTRKKSKKSKKGKKKSRKDSDDEDEDPDEPTISESASESRSESASDSIGASSGVESVDMSDNQKMADRVVKDHPSIKINTVIFRHLFKLCEAIDSGIIKFSLEEGKPLKLEGNISAYGHFEIYIKAAK